MRNFKRLVFIATLLLALVGGAGQASADPGQGGGSITTSAGATWEGSDVMLTAGVTWE